MFHKRIGDILLQQGVISEDQLEYCLKVQRNNGGQRLGKVLKHYDFLKEEQVLEALAYQVGWPLFSGREPLDEETLSELTFDYCFRNCVLPIVLNDRKAFVLAKTDDLTLTDYLRKKYGQDVPLLLAADEEIRRRLHAIEPYQQKGNEKELQAEKDLLLWFHQLLDRALKVKSSDIHLEASIKTVEIRIRIDGVLTMIDTLPLRLLSRLVNIIFYKAGVTISDFNHFHDARFTYQYQDRPIDARVSHLPAIHGSAIVIRLLDQLKNGVDLKSLGFCPQHWKLIEENLNFPYGLTLIVGPTGCGKTTTLYAMLNYLKSIDRKIITIEDPVEMHLSLMTQVQVNELRGISFSSAIRSFLRHDPDTILIGEIRDSETAQEAIRASMTGHQVFATLHANRPLDAVLRLQDLGISNVFIASNLRMIISQRLLRKRVQGRALVSEMLKISSEVEDALMKGDIAYISQFIKKVPDYITLLQCAERLALEGLVDQSEIKRVLG